MPTNEDEEKRTPSSTNFREHAENQRRQSPKMYANKGEIFGGEKQNIYQMKEVESIIQPDEKMVHGQGQKTQFNEYPYNHPSEKQSMAKQNAQKSLKSKLQKNQNRKKTNPTIIRRTMNNPKTPGGQNQYFSNNSVRNYSNRTNEIPKAPHNTISQFDQPNTQMIPADHFRQNQINDNQRPNQPQGRVTLPARYNTHIEPNQEQPTYGNMSNNNQAIAELNEFQPGGYGQPQEQSYQRNVQEAPRETGESNAQNPMDIDEDISQISLPNVKSNATLYKDIDPHEKAQLQKGPKLVKKEFVFKYNSDKNGLFYFLGTRGGRREYTNPFESGQIKVFFSSLAQGDYSNFVGRALTNCRTCNEENAFMGVDLGKERYSDQTVDPEALHHPQPRLEPVCAAQLDFRGRPGNCRCRRISRSGTCWTGECTRGTTRKPTRLCRSSEKC